MLAILLKNFAFASKKKKFLAYADYG